MGSNGDIPGALSLSNLYKHLKDVETIQQGLSHQKYRLASGQEPEVYLSDDYQVQTEDTEMHLSRAVDILKEQLKAVSVLEPLLKGIHQTLRTAVNICSKPGVRPLTILDLPDELLSHIFDYVKGHSISKHYYMEYDLSNGMVKKLRLTCKRFCNASSHLLIHFLSLGFDQESLSRLKDVSSHPLISKGIDCVRFTLRFYPADMASSIYKFTRYHLLRLRDHTDELESSLSCMYEDDPKAKAQASEVVKNMTDILNSWELFLYGSEDDPVDSTTPFIPRLHSLIATENSGHLLILRKAHGQYQHRFSQQQALLNKNKFVEAVATAFSRMPIARRLQLHDADIRWQRRNYSHWTRGATNHAELVRYMVDPMSAEEARELEFQTPGRILKLPIILPIAIHKAGTWLTGFSIHLSNPRNLSCLSMGKVELNDLRAATRRLEEFEFRPDQHNKANFWPQRSQTEMKHLQNYVSTAIDTDTLTSLSLDFGCYWSRDEIPVFEMGELMTHRMWPNLYGISLDGVPFQLSDIERFLKRPCGPQVFGLQTSYLLSGTWAEVLDMLRATRSRPGSYWCLQRPYGAERDILSKEELDRVFKRPDFKEGFRSCNDSNLAESYIRGWSRTNPLRGDATGITMTGTAEG